ncbi:hypothetical protein RJT34_13142 [Clitoria ternatea]|uniref:Uncharacterized protein n=1 Tax=Clitoria ternatea TaxID=43366 RepID=A0AAN9JR12_CLITE
MVALALLRFIVHDHDNLFVAVDAVHSLGIFFHCYKINLRHIHIITSNIQIQQKAHSEGMMFEIERKVVHTLVSSDGNEDHFRCMNGRLVEGNKGLKALDMKAILGSDGNRFGPGGTRGSGTPQIGGRAKARETLWQRLWSLGK